MSRAHFEFRQPILYKLQISLFFIDVIGKGMQTVTDPYSQINKIIIIVENILLSFINCCR